ncbi:MAG TPA: hypothetical protein VK837_12320 [Longimicrobiales bacterium]|nr:hypothetical protein [Longimicrobiales bacterium]
MRSIRTTAAALALGFAVAACGDQPTAPDPGDPALARGLDGASPSFDGWPVFKASELRRAFPGSPCQDAEHRQFDFWVGDWNVFNTSDVPSGTNFVTLELDGCLVQEHWTANFNGSQGQSLNTYDAETGLWYQSWVSQSPFGALRTDGGLVGDEMILTDDDRIGFLSDGSTTPLEDEWIWTPEGPDQVRQTGILRAPEIGFESSFVGIYKRSDDVQPVDPFEGTACLQGGPGAANRLLDFALGTWSVAPADGGAVLATSTFTSILSGCLMVEEFATLGPHPLRAIAYLYFDARDRLFHRIWVDSEGERVEQAGSFDGGALVLSGIEHGDGAPMLLRTIFEPAQGGGFIVTSDVSADEGATWMGALDLAYGAE